MDPITTGLLIALMVASFYFLIIRPNRKRQAEQAKLTESMQPGSRVMLNSGIYGTVMAVGDKQVSVELAPGVQVLVLKQAVLQVITPDSQFAEDAPIEGIDALAIEDEAPVIEDSLPADNARPAHDDRSTGRLDEGGDAPGNEGQKG